MSGTLLFVKKGVNLWRVGEREERGTERKTGERGRGEDGVAYLCLSGQGIHVEYEQGGTSLVSVSNISMVTRLLRGSFSLGPKILGKYLQQS